MSRNFELLEKIQMELADERDNNGAKTRTSNPEETKRRSPEPAAQIVDSNLVNIIQSVFAPISGNACRRVVFCRIGSVNTGRSVCGRVAHALAASTLEKVCVVDANPGAGAAASMTLSGPNHHASVVRNEHFQCVPVADHVWLASLPWPGPGQLIPIAEWRSGLDRLQGQFKYVLIDSSSNDAVVFGQISDGAILVIEADLTRREDAAKAKVSLERAGVRLLGTVLNNRSFPIPKALYERL